LKKYLLLRNNKKSGPHTYDEMVCLDLKPQDLVWVDGKSTAWRYPSEMPEFRTLSGFDPCLLTTSGKLPKKGNASGFSSPVFLPVPEDLIGFREPIPTLACFRHDMSDDLSTIIPSRQVFVFIPGSSEEQVHVVTVKRPYAKTNATRPATGLPKKTKPPLQPIIPEFRRSKGKDDLMEQLHGGSPKKIRVQFLDDDRSGLS
jgi:hypothetical protein